MIHRALLSEGDTVEGVFRTYTCSANTVPEGETKIVCQNDGQWSTTSLYCRRNYTFTVIFPNNYTPSKRKKIRTFWNYTNRKQDVCKIYTIYFYYVLIVANCGPTPVVERSVVNVDGTTLEGSIRYYQCTGGSVMEGEYNITCGQDGRWSDVRFYCRRTLKYDIFKIKWYSEFGILMLVWLKQCIFRTVFIYLFSANCNQPPLIPRATVDTSTGTLEGDIAVYTCGVNTVQEGFGETVCQKNGMWSEVDMYCRRKY